MRWCNALLKTVHCTGRFRTRIFYCGRRLSKLLFSHRYSLKARYCFGTTYARSRQLPGNCYVCFFAASDTAEWLITSQPCTLLALKFSHKDYNFGSRYNTTFFVYLYNFRAPFLLQVRDFRLLGLPL